MKQRIFRTLSLALCLALCLGLVPARAAEVVNSGTCGENLTWSLNSEGELRISGAGPMPDFSAYKNGGAPWYDNKAQIVSVVVEEGVTAIGDYAFYQCAALAQVSLPSTLTSLGRYAIGNCYALTSATIPEGVTVVGNYVFGNDKGLIRVDLPQGLETIGEGAFAGCEALTQIAVPAKVAAIDKYAFNNCVALERVELPEGLETIGENAFEGCAALTRITLPSTLTYLGPLAFRETGLTHVTIPAGMDAGQEPFYKSALETVTIEPGRTAIPKCMFYGCASLRSVVIPEGVTTIGWHAFQGCTALTSVTIPSTVTVIEAHAFGGCSSLTGVDLPQHLDVLGGYAFSGCSSLKSMVVPEGVTEMQSTFQDCYALEKVTLPQSLTELQASDFQNCSSLEEIVIPPKVTKIGWDSFYGCSKLKKINLPEGLTEIGPRAFVNCSSLKEITLPSTLREMEGDVFSFTGLTRINIPVSLEMAYGTYDGRYSSSSFRNSSIRTFVFDEGRTAITRSLVNGVQNYIIPASVTSIEKNALPGWDRTNIFFLGTQEQWEAVQGHEPANVGTERVFFGDEEQAQEIPRDGFLVRVVDQEGKPYAGITVKTTAVQYETDDNGCATVILEEGRLPYREFYRNGSRAASRPGGTPENGETGETVVITRYEQTVTPAEIRPEATYCQFSTRADMSGAVDITTRNQLVDVNATQTIYLRVGVSDESRVERVELRSGYGVVAELVPGQITAVPVSELKVGGSYAIRVWDKEGKTTTRQVNLVPTEQEFEELRDLSLDFDEIAIPIGEGVPFLGGGELKLNLPVELPMTGKYDGESQTFRVGINLAQADFSDKDFEEIKQCVSSLGKIGDAVRRGDLYRLQRLAGESYKSELMDNSPVEFILAGYLEGQGNGKGSLEVLRGQLVIGVKVKGEFGFQLQVAVVPVVVQVEIGLEAKAIGALTYRVPTQTVTGSLELSLKPSLEVFGGVGVGKAIGVGAYGKAELEMMARVLGAPQGLKKVTLTGELGVKAYLGPLEYSKGFATATWQIWPREKTAEEAALFDLYDAGAYRRQDLGYLAQESGWQENGDYATLFAAAQGTNLQTLLGNTYRNAQPSLAATSDALYAALLRADPETEDVYVAVSKYDGSAWSEPVRCDAAAALDGAPSLAVDAGGTVWLAFTQTAADFDPDSLLSYAQKQSLVVGTVDPATCAFAEVKRYQGAGYLHLAQLGLAGGQPVLAWADSPVTDDDSVLWPAAGDICTAAYQDGGWGESQWLTQVGKPITDLAVGEGAGALSVAYVADEDGDSQTQADRSLYLDAGADPVARNVQGRVSFAALPGGSGDFLWNGGDGLYTADGLAIPAAGITGEYALTADRLYYSTAGGGAADLTAVTYSGGGWSAPVKLTNGARYLENLNVARMGGKDYLLGMYTNAAIDETDGYVTDAKDLIWASVEPVSDLRLEVGEIEGAMTPGEYVQVPVTVYNAGDHDVTALQFTCGARLSGSYVILSPALAPGQSWTGAVGVRCPESYYSYTLTVNESGDFTPEDNAATVELGMADLAVELTERRVEGNSTLVAVVRNEGVDVATARGQFVNDRGEILGGFVVTDLVPGETATALCQDVETGGDYTVRLMCLDPDRYSYNDSATLYVDQPSRIVSVLPGGGKVTVEVNAAKPGELWCALYDGGGKLLAAASQTVEAGRQSVELGVSLPTAQAARVKAFLLDANAGPQCEAGSWEKN